MEKKYAYIVDDKEIYIINKQDSHIQKVFSTQSGRIPGFSWSADDKSIITAVVEKKGCGNKLDGLTKFLLIDLNSSDIQILREVKWSLNGWDLSPDQKSLLTRWWLCVGNSYEMDGVISLDSEAVTWPLDRFASYGWTQDGDYLIKVDGILGQHYFIDPSTGSTIGNFGPDILVSLLNDNEIKDYVIHWESQPFVASNNSK